MIEHLVELLSQLQISGLNGILALLLIFSLLFFMLMQLYSWMTPPDPHLLGALTVGVILSGVVTGIIYSTEPLAPAVVGAAIAGVYGLPGYVWIAGMGALVFVFLMNTIQSWKENRPLEVFQ